MNFDQVTQTEIVIIFICLFVSACKVVLPPVNWSALLPNKGNTLPYYLIAKMDKGMDPKCQSLWLLGLRVLFLIRDIYTADGEPDGCRFYSKHPLFPFKL